MARSTLTEIPVLVGRIVPVMLLVAALYGAPASAQTVALVPAPRSPAQTEAVEQASEGIRTWLAENDIPGVTVAVGLDDYVVWAEGFGWADLEQQVPVTALTRFRTGSVGKALTAAAVGLLVERGRLDLDAPVQRYVSGFPEKRWPVSTRQLMAHTAGVRHYRGDDEPLSAVHYDDVLASLDIFAGDSLLFRPGTAYGYSTYGWNLVGAVVQEASGRPFLEFMRLEVFSPARMTSTVPDDVFGIVPHRARFYDRDPEGHLRNADFVDQSNKWPGGGYLSTPSDLVRFGFAMLDRELLEPETVELLWTPVTVESGEPTPGGLGWALANVQGRAMVGHGGRSVGGTAALMIFPEERMIVSVMTNVTAAAPAPIALLLARLFDPAAAGGEPGHWTIPRRLQESHR
ncbi:MAG: serine hydrolase domain-containing protein [Gemmatimonadota bacterium]|nr:serine hydrolase domain-containing protein [Gemmatimonadota bacterium]